MKHKFLKYIMPAVLFVTGSLCAFAAENVTQPAGVPPITLTAGQDFVSFDVTFIATVGTKNLKLTIEQPTGIAGAVTPVEFANVKYEKVVDEVVAGSEVITMTLQAKAAAGARDGMYTVPVAISYDGSGADNEEQLYFKITVPVITPGEPDRSSLVIKSFRVSEGYADKPIDPGDQFMVTVMTENKGNTLLEDVHFSLRNLTPDTFVLLTGAGDIYADIAPGDKGAASFMLQSNPAILPGKYLVTVRAEYRDHNNLLKFEEAQLFVTIAGDEKPDSEYSTPIVMIDKYSYGGDTVTGGQTFNLNLNFINTNKLSSVDNLKVTLTDPSDIYVPKKSSNTFYFEKVDAGASFQHTILMQAARSAEPKSYQIDVRYEYETVINGTRRSVANTETISIPLVQKEMLSVDELLVPKEILINTPTPIAATFINKGKTDLSNLTVTVMGSFEGGEQPYYVGTLAPGRSDSYDANLTATTVGSITGYLVFTYDGFEGDTKEYRTEFSTVAVEQLSSKKETSRPVFKPMDVPANAEEKPGLLERIQDTVNLSGLMGAAVLIAVVGAFWYVKKKAKKS